MKTKRAIKRERALKQNGQRPFAEARGYTAARPLQEVLEEIRRITNRGAEDGVIGYAIQWRTPKGSTLQMQWGQLRSKLP